MNRTKEPLRNASPFVPHRVKVLTGEFTEPGDEPLGIGNDTDPNGMKVLRSYARSTPVVELPLVVRKYARPFGTSVVMIESPKKSSPVKLPFMNPVFGSATPPRDA